MAYRQADVFTNLLQSLKTNVSISQLNLNHCNLSTLVIEEGNGPLIKEVLTDQNTTETGPLPQSYR